MAHKGVKMTLSQFLITAVTFLFMGLFTREIFILIREIYYRVLWKINPYAFPFEDVLIDGHVQEIQDLSK